MVDSPLVIYDSGVDSYGMERCRETVANLQLPVGVPTNLHRLLEGQGLAVRHTLLEPAELEMVIEKVLEKYGRYLETHKLIDALYVRSPGTIEVLLRGNLDTERKNWAIAHEMGHAIAYWHTSRNLCIAGFVDHPAFEAEADFMAAEILFQGCEFTRRAELQPNCLATPLALRKTWGTPRTKTITRYVTQGHKPRAAFFLPLPRTGNLDSEGIIRTSESFDNTYGPNFFDQPCAQQVVEAITAKAIHRSRSNQNLGLGSVYFPCDDLLKMRVESTRTKDETIVLLTLP